VARTRRVVVEVPEHLDEATVRVELALRLYEKRLVSLGQARRIAGLPKWEFLELLARERIPIDYDEDELEEDLEAVEWIVRGQC